MSRLLTVALILTIAVGWLDYAGDKSEREAGAATVSRPEGLYQGKSVRWWARRAVQARKDANARGRTIKRLRRELRSAGPSWAWLAAAACIQQHEGTWNDPNGPYYGGMQADLAFQRAYGHEYLIRWGTADNWPWWAQLHMAWRGWAVRGWQPWPTTARRCGLL